MQAWTIKLKHRRIFCRSTSIRLTFLMLSPSIRDRSHFLHCRGRKRRCYRCNRRSSLMHFSHVSDRWLNFLILVQICRHKRSSLNPRTLLLDTESTIRYGTNTPRFCAASRSPTPKVAGQPVCVCRKHYLSSTSFSDTVNCPFLQIR